MKQRAAIARALAMEPRILLMDEPFAALDALTRAQMQEELLQLWQETKFTVLFVTHSISEAIRIGTRILVLSAHPGQVKAELNSEDCDEARLREMTLPCLTGPRRLWDIGAVRKTFLLIVLALIWEGYARWLNNPLLFPNISGHSEGILFRHRVG